MVDRVFVAPQNLSFFEDLVFLLGFFGFRSQLPDPYMILEPIGCFDGIPGGRRTLFGSVCSGKKADGVWG